MQANAFCFLRLFSGLLAFAAAGSAHGEGMKLVAQHIEAIGARQWLGVAAASFVATTPVIAPVKRLATAWSRKTQRVADSEPEAPHAHSPYVLTDNFA